LSSKTGISLYTISWNGYWEKYGSRWSEKINSLNISPDEIIIVSDRKIDLSKLNNKNVLLILAPTEIEYSRKHSVYRNLAIGAASSKWIVASDLDDLPLPNLLDNINNDCDIFSFGFRDKNNDYFGGNDVLKNRLWHIPASVENNNLMIPGTSAIKKSLFSTIRYEHECAEDAVLYATLATQNLKVGYDNNIRFLYSGWSGESKETMRITNIYLKMLRKEYRPLYVCWFSGSNISSNRLGSLKTLYKMSGVDVELVTDKNFYNYENAEIPIHQGFKYLSDVHKSDYARAYLMYFYGGGYSDLKPNSFDWNQYFEKLLVSKYDAIGYLEPSADQVSKFYLNDDSVKKDTLYNKFSGNGHYIFKPKTAFAKKWLKEIHSFLDKNIDQLVKNPGTYHPRAVFGGVHKNVDGLFSNSLYPLRWDSINGMIKSRLEYELGFSTFLLDMPYPITKNYL
jgi:hypothetical protein